LEGVAGGKFYANPEDGGKCLVTGIPETNPFNEILGKVSAMGPWVRKTTKQTWADHWVSTNSGMSGSPVIHVAGEAMSRNIEGIQIHGGNPNEFRLFSIEDIKVFRTPRKETTAIINNIVPGVAAEDQPFIRAKLDAAKGLEQKAMEDIAYVKQLDMSVEPNPDDELKGKTKKGRGRYKKYAAQATHSGTHKIGRGMFVVDYNDVREEFLTNHGYTMDDLDDAKVRYDLWTYVSEVEQELFKDYNDSLLSTYPEEDTQEDVVHDEEYLEDEQEKADRERIRAKIPGYKQQNEGPKKVVFDAQAKQNDGGRRQKEWRKKQTGEAAPISRAQVNMDAQKALLKIKEEGVTPVVAFVPPKNDQIRKQGSQINKMAQEAFQSLGVQIPPKRFKSNLFLDPSVWNSLSGAAKQLYLGLSNEDKMKFQVSMGGSMKTPTDSSPKDEVKDVVSGGEKPQSI